MQFLTGAAVEEIPHDSANCPRQGRPSLASLSAPPHTRPMVGALPFARRRLRVLDNREIEGGGPPANAERGGAAVPALRLLVIERDVPFDAGQLLGLSTDATIPPRLYSIASGEGEANWELLYTVENKGILSPRLAELRRGDEILVEGPSGTFGASVGPAAWVGGGTGVAPFVSLARSGKTRGVHLVHAAARPWLFYGEVLFEALLGSAYHRCCPRAEEGDSRYFRGRATTFIERAAKLPLDLPWLLCGGGDFVVDTRAALLARGVPYARILAEVYF